MEHRSVQDCHLVFGGCFLSTSTSANDKILMTKSTNSRDYFFPAHITNTSVVCSVCMCVHVYCVWKIDTESGWGGRRCTHTGVQAIGISFELQPGDSYRYQQRNFPTCETRRPAAVWLNLMLPPPVMGAESPSHFICYQIICWWEQVLH